MSYPEYSDSHYPRHGTVVGPPDMGPSASWTHEAEYAPSNLSNPDYYASPASHVYSPPIQAGSHSRVGYFQPVPQRSSGSYSKDAHGGAYHYGRVWDSESLQERYDASSWVTTSTATWTENADTESPTAELNYQYPPVELSSTQLDASPSHSIGSVFEAPPVLVPSHGLYSGPSLVSAQKLQARPPPPLDPEPIYVAHLPVPPEKQSTYSEFTPNLIFLEKLREEEQRKAQAKALAVKARPLTITIPKPSRRASSTPDKDNVDSANLPSPTKKRKKTNSTRDVDSPQETGASNDVSTGRGGEKNVKEPRKPSLACTFCRERKISCGRPPLVVQIPLAMC
ncbi:hypothetical protein CPB84DRAFT_369512 [Gymnopilus junonius]|uniref:Uncharacterized protein n=1 Tax=Gymnopilus junonius TaxID=109634 RepID=A0A9P5NC46_GYMJU|nr:hypothetical protein CPB84DRAFT_369512 [Gymnopilus junonius]